jgi:subtilisin
MNAEGKGTDGDIISGIAWAILRGANIINMSLGGMGHAEPLCQAVAAAVARRIVVVAAAGNDQGTSLIGSPGDCPGSWAVTAVASNGQYAPFSTSGGLFGKQPTFIAPGVKVLSAMPGGRAAILSGTSMAAPHVSGLAALSFQATGDASRVPAKPLGLGPDFEGAGLAVTDPAWSR